MLELWNASEHQLLWVCLIGLMGIGTVCVIKWITISAQLLSTPYTAPATRFLPLDPLLAFYESKLPWWLVARLKAYAHDKRTQSTLNRPQQRALWVLLAGLVSLGLVVCLILLLCAPEDIEKAVCKLLLGNTPSAGFWSIVYSVCIAPIAYVLWWFRDTNQLWQIENQRKDINLKDFQKLSEWASGSTLVEEEVTTTGKGEVNTIKSTRPPASETAQSGTRRRGSEVLQIASVQQLGSYLLGENGGQFQRPALELLIALWQSQTQDIRSEASSILNQEHPDNVSNPIGSWLDKVAAVQNSNLARAITYALLAKENRALLQLSEYLPKQVLTGLSTELPGLPPLKFWLQRLDAIELQGANLPKAELQGASLIGAQLSGANLSRAQLQGAKLNAAMLRHTNLLGAQLAASDLTVAHMENANLADAQLQKANLYCAYLNFAKLEKCQLDKSRLVRAQLVRTHMHGASFANADLRGARLVSPRLNTETSFLNAKADSSTVVEVDPQFSPRPMNNIHGQSLVPLLTHALRLALREKNRLELPVSAYEEFLSDWSRIDKSTQKDILENAYGYVDSPGNFLMVHQNLKL